jgi:hypothetical protein
MPYITGKKVVDLILNSFIIVTMKRYLLLLVPLVLSSCATTNDRYGFFPGAGMDEDSQDRHNTKYNLMDSPDGRQDPNANVRVWGAVY